VRALATILTLLCALALAGAAVGCGDDDSDASRQDESDEIRAAGAVLEDAIEADDSEAFCDALAPGYVEEIGGTEACLKLYDPKTYFLFRIPESSKRGDMSVRNVDFEDDNHATAYLANKGFLYFTKEDGKWYPTFPTQ
jgi:hypothetical protein